MNYFILFSLITISLIKQVFTYKWLVWIFIDTVSTVLCWIHTSLTGASLLNIGFQSTWNLQGTRGAIQIDPKYIDNGKLFSHENKNKTATKNTRKSYHFQHNGLETIMLKEINRTEKQILYDLTYICNLNQ